MAKDRDEKLNKLEIERISDAIKNLGSVSKSEAKSAKKNLGVISKVISNFGKKMQGTQQVKAIQGMDQLGEGVQKLGEVGKKQRKNAVSALDALGKTLKKFNENVKDTQVRTAVVLDKTADGISNLSKVTKKSRKGLVSDLDAINKAVTRLTAVKKGGKGTSMIGGLQSKVGLKEAKAETDKAKKEDTEQRVSMFEGLRNTFSEKLGVLTDAVRQNKPEKKGIFSKIFGGIMGLGPTLLGLPALIGTGIKGFLPDWLTTPGGLIKTLGEVPSLLFKSGGLLFKGIGGLFKAGGVLFKLLTGPLGMIAGAGILGYAAGTWLYNNLVGPWLDDYYAEEQRIAGTSSQQTRVAGMVKDPKTGKKEKGFRISEEMAQKHQTGSTIVSESQLKAIEEAEGGKVESRAYTKAVHTETGQSLYGGRDLTTDEGMAAQKEHEAAKEAGRAAMSKGGEQGKKASMKKTINTLASRALVAEQKLFGFLHKGHKDRDKAVENEKRAQSESEAIYDSYYNLLDTATNNPTYGASPQQVKDIFRQFPLVWAMLNSPGRAWWEMWSVSKGKDDMYRPTAMTRFPVRTHEQYLKNYSGGPNGLWDGEKVMPGYSKVPGPNTPFALGGLVKGPVNALLGEAGPEVVLPLNKAPQMIADVLAKAAKNLSGQQVKMQGLVSNITQGAMGGGAPRIVTNNVMSSNRSTYNTPSSTAKSVNGIQYKLKQMI